MFEKMNGETPDLTKDNIEKLKQLFPEIETDGKIDFEKLQVILGKEIDDAPDRYNFTWHGKKETMQFAQQPSKGTLRPIKEKSENWDTTGNLYIEGDNLEVLKLLQKSYNNKVKMIYIDPPYNTGNDFVYKDNFKDSVDSYMELTGQKDGEGNKFTTNTEGNGRYHTDWLNMMYSRLKLARNLLTPDGVIFISIDDNEQDNMKKLGNEIFGESNFITQFTIVSNSSKNNSKYVSVVHEYVLCYAKYKNNLGEMWKAKKKNVDEFKKRAQMLLSSDLTEKEINKELNELVKYPKFYDFDHYTHVDDKGPFRASDLTAPGSKTFYDVRHPVTKEICKIGTRGWAYTQESMSELINQNRIFFGKDGSVMPQLKNYLYENEESTPKSVLFFDSQSSTKWMKANKFGFDFPKSTDFIKYIISMIPSKECIILDFFSGSATTAHATMELNAEDGGSRKFIMVQLPELIKENSEAKSEGYHTICDIGEERIRRAGEKVRSDLIAKNNKVGTLLENQVDPDDLDIGFKVFKLGSSNLTEWQAEFDELESNIDLFESNFLNDRSELDILFEIMLKNGLDLTYPVTEISEGSHKIYDVASGNLFVCLNDNINRDVARKIAALRKEYGIETSQVVFKDSGFDDDTEKLNCYEILKEAGYQDSDLLSI